VEQSPKNDEANLSEELPRTVNENGDLTVELVDAVRAEFDSVIPHVVQALKANDSAQIVAKRLADAERRLAERDNRPIVSGLTETLRRVRKLEFEADAKATVVGDLESVLIGAGYSEFDDLGDRFDPARHEAISGVSESGEAVVVEVLEPGLEALGDVIVRARVVVGDDELERNSAAVEGEVQ
jgi:hypothetical protein